MNVQSVVSEVLNLLSYIPGEVSKQVNGVELVTTISTAIAQLKAGQPTALAVADVLQAVVDAAAVIFPGASLYKRAAVELLSIAINLYKSAHAASAPAAAA